MFFVLVNVLLRDLRSHLTECIFEEPACQLVLVYAAYVLKPFVLICVRLNVHYCRQVCPINVDLKKLFHGDAIQCLIVEVGEEPEDLLLLELHLVEKSIKCVNDTCFRLRHLVEVLF